MRTFKIKSVAIAEDAVTAEGVHAKERFFFLQVDLCPLRLRRKRGLYSTYSTYAFLSQVRKPLWNKAKVLLYIF